MQAAYTPIIKSGDVLSITVNGMDKDDREIFSATPTTVSQRTQVPGFVMLYEITGFTVDMDGFIVLPQVGRIRVAGLTTKKVESNLIEQLEPYVKSPTVSVHIANYIISILGEVSRPAQYVIPNNRITLPEALALAGDLTIYGNRKNVLIMRELDGQRHFARVDLTQRNLFESPYYYLHASDVVYIEPTRGRLTSTDRFYQLTPLVISSLSFLFLVINNLTKNN